VQGGILTLKFAPLYAAVQTFRHPQNKELSFIGFGSNAGL